jgi:glucan-binding YG repeat protein
LSNLKHEKRKGSFWDESESMKHQNKEQPVHSRRKGLRKRGVLLRVKAAAVLAVAALALGCVALVTGNKMREATPDAPGWHKSEEGRYYISSQTGDRLRGFYQIGKHLYYFNEDGLVETGWVTITGYQGYADPKGRLVMGDHKIRGILYHFQQTDGQLYTGWVTLGDTVYCYDETGAPRSGYYHENGSLWYLNKDGSVYIGYRELEDGKTYYFSEDGQALDAFATIDGKRYYFDGSGNRVSGWYKTMDGWYLFDENGVVQTGWQERDDQKYYYMPSGELAQGWQTVDGALRYFNEDGTLAQGWMHLADGVYAFVDGVSQTGWAENGTRRGYLDGNGHCLTGWNVIDGQPYAFDQSGALKQGWDYANGTDYYFVNGVSQVGSIDDTISGYSLNGCGSAIITAVTEQTEAAAEADAEQAGAEETQAESELPGQQQETEASSAAVGTEQPAMAAVPQESAGEQTPAAAQSGTAEQQDEAEAANT